MITYRFFVAIVPGTLSIPDVAFVPDLQVQCGGRDIEQTLENVKAEILKHLTDLELQGHPVPMIRPDEVHQRNPDYQHMIWTSVNVEY